MSIRNTALAATLAASLAGCVDRGDWKPAPKLEPQALGAQQALAGARLDAAAWPADPWWRGYGDPQQREPSRVADDVRLGLVSPDVARHDYGVVVDRTGAIDETATKTLRNNA